MLERGYTCPDIQQIADSRGMDNNSILDTTLNRWVKMQKMKVSTRKEDAHLLYAFKCEVRDEI